MINTISPKVKILIIDDEIMLAIILKYQLQKFGYEVYVGPINGEEAINYTLNLKPDLVLMDIYLDGDQDGIEVTKKINAVLDIRIIYPTAFADENTINRASISSPYGYLIKPIAIIGVLHSSIEIALYNATIGKKD
jgi:response regulator of citrate/malate metabolism